MDKLELSPKLTDYLKKIENEAGCEISFRQTNDLQPSGMRFAFRYDPSDIVVVTTNINIVTPEDEISIAHEATHGFLINKLGYCHPVFNRPPTASETLYIGLIGNMIDDIVVNKLIHQEGFAAFSPTYISMVEKEIEATNRGSEECYKEFFFDPTLKDRFMVFRYVLAWGFNRYFDLEPHAKRTVRMFVSSFRKAFKKQLGSAKRITDLISQNDIFTPEGHRKVYEGVLKLWQLEDRVELKD
ncbi:hypothetical protein ACFLUJ_05235 [Chloroflexota bacterium]